MDVTSFGIDHNRLLRGIYVSRKDTVGDGVLTTFDVRMKEPNREMVMDTSVMHTIEHLMATFFRGHEQWADKTIYVRASRPYSMPGISASSIPPITECSRSPETALLRWWRISRTLWK